ncbi:peptidase inhibitor family I36 protein [Streptomyces rimosus]
MPISTSSGWRNDALSGAGIGQAGEIPAPLRELDTFAMSPACGEKGAMGWRGLASDGWLAAAARSPSATAPAEQGRWLMKMRALALVGAAVLAALPLTAGTASAATKCPSGDVCGWTKANFGGSKYTESKPTPGCFPMNGARSVSNQTKYRVTFTRGQSCEGAHFDVAPGHYSAKTPWPVVSAAVWGP